MFCRRKAHWPDTVHVLPHLPAIPHPQKKEKSALLLRLKQMLNIFTIQACAFSALRQPQSCARTAAEGGEKKDPRRRLQRKTRQQGPRRRSWKPVDAFAGSELSTGQRHRSAAKQSIHVESSRLTRDWASSLQKKPCSR
ncbi:hypothetical protein M431DRAFT_362835 [Trichoderma harzianum CBS 226.95]|uniref:Uncharacterized protein n=1 Tax=Trichoderma harzianum CBS 226.95 TaxID=983964 RepID=A0A2T4AMN1_TRIHA|nr:hypothetical protein M431DRAFT_362835 [Trichoderma harzianum CBS 226.95]PTB58336.1 hypothetical protein M431DRAFT_362835 [Trichoderma harzianum CBS 226.95]